MFTHPNTTYNNLLHIELPTEEQVAVLPLTLAKEVYALLDRLTASAGEDEYYGHFCRVCQYQGIPEDGYPHENWCPVPEALRLRDQLKELGRPQDLMKALP